MDDGVTVLKESKFNDAIGKIGKQLFHLKSNLHF